MMSLILLSFFACSGNSNNRDLNVDVQNQRGDVDVDEDGWGSSMDCDDENPSVYPGAQEICADKVDNDCDGVVDQLDGTAARQPYCATRDEDAACADYNGDGVLDESDSINLCNPEEAAVAIWAAGGDTSVIGTVLIPLEDAATDPDCDDTDATSYPGATEVCDGADNNCDGAVDEGTPGESTWYQDADEDTYGDPAVTVMSCEMPEGYVADWTDCDDTNAAVNPAAVEICDTIDNDCDEAVDDDDASISDQQPWYDDLDDDGYGAGTATMACDAPDGSVDNNDDCNDGINTVYPGAEEVCNDLDDDCDGSVDVGATDQTTWYRDYDGDGYGQTTGSFEACDEPPGYVSMDSDCDDTVATTNPGATETYNGVDDDCDTLVDDGAACAEELDYDSVSASVTSMVVSGTPGGFDGDLVTGVVGWSYSSANYGGLWLATGTSEAFCLVSSGDDYFVDITLSDGTRGCVLTGTAEGDLSAFQGGEALSTARYDVDSDGDSVADYCVIRVWMP